MIQKQKAMATVALAASAAMLLYGCGQNTASNSSSKDSATPVDGGTLTVAQGTPWNDEFIPNLDSSGYTEAMWQLSFDPLLNVDNKLQLQPWLVQKYQYSPDHKTITCWLQPNAKWSDGQPIVSRDVLLDMDFLASPAYNGPHLQGQSEYLVDNVVGADKIVKGEAKSFADTGGFTIINDKEFQVHVKQADAAFLTADLANITPLPYHRLKGIPFSQYLEMQYDRLPDVVSGPYIPTSATNQSVDTFKANPNYWRGKPHIANVVLKVVSPDVLPGMMASGQVNFAINGLSANDKIKMKSDPQIVEKTMPSTEYAFLGLKDNKPYFSDVRVRQAIAYAINRQAIINGIFKGMAVPINSPTPDSYTWAATPASQLNTYDYNPKKAEQLLDEAGYVKKGQWRIDPKTGQTLTLHLATTTDPTRASEANAIQQDLQAVGIHVVEDSPIDFNTLVSRLENNDPSIDMWLMGNSMGPDPDPRGTWGTKDPGNYERYSNPEIDKLIQNTWALPSDFTQAGRGQQFQTFNKFVNQQLPIIFLFDYNDVQVYRSNVHIPDKYFGPMGVWPVQPDWWISK
ncbi:ABC transporter substrate-binding protein [Alicyclobacillus contaminans]|uniref:ABC transporter substrate-binding protein n=1 Tax=Alicyclobacillus contaminans TaxID=392016 RepID=UPI0003F6CE41|nr:ABC transporter substrate-binding protein [Alicyclobacillus contaminans]GMA50372.1 ABC transporter substrate-binding protein [Alicyclobacillus contaminans]